MSLIKKLIYKFFFNDTWTIGTFEFEGKSLDEIKFRNIKWYKFTSFSYEADPFFLKIDEKFFIAFEVFSVLSAFGELKVFDLHGNEYQFFSEVNKNKQHKSYPFIFYDKEEIYCVPEECNTRKLNLYKFDRTTQKFKHERTLLSGEEFIDSNLFKIKDTYFISISTLDKPQLQRLYYSKSLELNFKEHRNSPIQNSKKYGRNAGFIEYKNDCFRISQDFSKYYGEKISIHKITKCDDSAYEEEKRIEIDKYNFSEKILGIHTLNNFDKDFVFDSKQVVFDVFNPFKKFIKKIKLMRL